MSFGHENGGWMNSDQRSSVRAKALADDSANRTPDSDLDQSELEDQAEEVAKNRVRDLADLLVAGRDILSAKRQSEADANSQKAETEYASTVKHWAALVECVKATLPTCLHQFVNLDLDIELAQAESAGANHYDMFHGKTRDDHDPIGQCAININVPGCTEIVTKFFFNKENSWEHWTIDKPSHYHATYRVAVYAKDRGQYDSEWFVYSVKDRETKWANDLAEALAHAEEAYRAMNVLLGEAEKDNAEQRKTLLAQQEARLNRRRDMTTAEKLVEVLGEFVAEHVPEQE